MKKRRAMRIVFGVLIFFLFSCGKLKTLEAFLKFSSFQFPSALSGADLKICMKQTRFKKPNETTAANKNEDPDNKEVFQLITLKEAGTLLSQSFQVEEGSYERIEIDLEDACGTGYSVQLTYNNQTYKTSQEIELTFRGNFQINAKKYLLLAIQTLINQLSGVQSDQALFQAFQNASELEDAIEEHDSEP